MNWTKASAYHMDGEDGWRLCQALTPAGWVYTLSRRGMLVESSTDLEALKRRAESES